MATDGKRILVKVYRKQKLSWLEVEVPVEKWTTVLDVLKYIKKNVDHTLAFRYQCEMGSCGSCGVVVNSKPVLACKTLISELKADTIEIEPLYNLPVIKDLVVDQELMFKKYNSVKPFILPKMNELLNIKGEFILTQKEQNEFISYAACINCGLCYSACPTIALNKEFLGPHTLNALYRYYSDIRLDSWIEILNSINKDKESAIWNCHYAGACSKVCPVNVDPASSIQKMKKEFLFTIMKIEKKRREPNIFIRDVFAKSQL
ncbi:MAG: succinate dehydrogenase/fumarate reductase iron-sulfur subunit [Thermoprotei archaeon]